MAPSTNSTSNSELIACTSEIVKRRAFFYQAVGMNTEFFFDGPIGLLYYAGPAWTFLAIVIFLVLMITRNRP